MIEDRILHPVFEAHQIIPRLWLGSFPKPALGTDALLRSGITMLVLSAAQEQLPGYEHLAPAQGVKIVRVALYDKVQRLSDESWQKVRDLAKQVADEYRVGGQILVTCLMGANRSSLIVAKTLSLLCPDWPMQQIIEYVRQKRYANSAVQVLGNHMFVEALLTRP